MAMMAITTSSSISVKPPRRRGTWYGVHFMARSSREPHDAGASATGDARKGIGPAPGRSRPRGRGLWAGLRAYDGATSQEITARHGPPCPQCGGKVVPNRDGQIVLK